MRRELSWTNYRMVLPSEEKLRRELDRERQALTERRGAAPVPLDLSQSRGADRPCHATTCVIEVPWADPLDRPTIHF